GDAAAPLARARARRALRDRRRHLRRRRTGARWASHHDVAVLDVMMPDGSGIELCGRLRAARVATPILLLTARGDVRSRVLGLEAGADDYLAKPFALAELRARVTALGRRGPLRERAVAIGPILVEIEAHRVTVDGAPVLLTAKELAILEVL